MRSLSLVFLAQLCNIGIKFERFPLNTCFRTEWFFVSRLRWGLRINFLRENICLHKLVDPNTDSKAIAIFFTQLNFSGKGFQQVKIFFPCFQLFPAIPAYQQISMCTSKDD